MIAQRSGGDPTHEQLHQATVLWRKLARRLLGAASTGTLGTLAALQSAGWRIGLVSNITSETQLQWPESPLPLYFETTVFSAEVGAAKTEPEIYMAACNALGVSPSECVYVGDGRDNELPGAAALGMYAIRTTEHSYSDPTWTGPTVTSFTELPDLIGIPA